MKIAPKSDDRGLRGARDRDAMAAVLVDLPWCVALAGEASIDDGALAVVAGSARDLVPDALRAETPRS
jgi:hypothetical protein